MPKIPRTEASIPIRMADQPPMNPDALTGPGKALQGLGRAIAGLGGAFDAMSQPGDQDILSAQLAQMDAATASEKYYNERLASFTPDTDPDTWHQDTTKGIGAIWDDASSRVPAYPKLQNGFAVNRHRFTGNYDVRAHGFATKEKTERFATGALETFKRGLDTIDPTTPEGIAAIDTIEKQLGRVPGLDIDKARDALAGEMLKRFEAEAEKDPIEGLKKIEAIEKWREQFKVRPQGVGPQSSIQDFTQGRNFAALPASNVKNIVLHDVSGNDPVGRSLPKGGNIPHYHITFDDKGIYNEIALDQRAPHAASFNKSSIGIAYIGFEGDKLSPQAVANGAQAVKMVADRFGISPNHILTHPGAGPSATNSGGKDPREAAWKKDVLSYIDNNLGGLGGASVAQGESAKVNLTAYSPQKGASNSDGGEGNYLSAKPGPDGKNEVRTLADEASGRSKYVTLAGNPRDYDKRFIIPRITFVDAKGQRHTRTNVLGIVHDTGSAFANAPEGRFDIPIDRDATTKQMHASAAMWKKDGVQFIPQDAAPPVAERGIAQYAGSQPNRVADASGSIGAPSGGQISERIAGRIGGQQDQPNPEPNQGQRAENTIPGQQTAQGLSPQEFMRQQQEAQDRASPGQVRTQNEVWDQPSIRTRVLDKLGAVKDRVSKLAEKQLKEMEGALRVSRFLTQEEQFNRYDDDARKLVNDTFKLGDLHTRILSGDPDAIARGVEVSKRLGYVPEVVQDSLLALVKNRAPSKAQLRMAGYQAAGAILADYPDAFMGEDGNKLASESRDFLAMADGMGPEQALLRMDEMKSPEWEKKKTALGPLATEALKSIDAVSIMRDYLDDSALPFTAPGADNMMAVMVGDFQQKFRDNFIRLGGDAESAKKRTIEEMGTYGVTNVSGSKQMMRFPPEKHYPAIGPKGYDYLSKDIEKAVRTYLDDKANIVEVGASNEIEGGSDIGIDQIFLHGDYITKRDLAAGKSPTYQVWFRDKNGTLQMIPDRIFRWSMQPQDIRAQQSKYRTQQMSKRKDVLGGVPAGDLDMRDKMQAEDARIKERDANSPYAPSVLLKKGAKRIMDYINGNGDLPMGMEVAP